MNSFFKFNGLVLAFVFAWTASASVDPGQIPATLINRTTVDRLVESGSVDGQLVLEVTPQAFIKMHPHAMPVKVAKEAMLAISVIICTGAFCAMLARDYRAHTKPHVDPNMDIVKPPGGW